jgi:chorismate mutase
VAGLEEVYWNQTSKVISFVNDAWECRINVYYTTGTVGTCLDHPTGGKTQLFRRDVDYELLKEIFENPRAHTGTGYYRTDANLPVRPPTNRTRKMSRHYDEVSDEETEIRCQLDILQPQVDLLRSQLAVLVTQRIAKAEEAARLKRERAALKTAIHREVEQRVALRLREVEARQRAEYEQHATTAIEEVTERAARTYRGERARTANLRGNSCHHSLRYDQDIPTSLVDVVSVAVSDGGYVAVLEDGSCSYDGVNSELAAELGRQHLSNIQYVAAGPAGQYYIRKTNGRSMCAGCDEFVEVLDRVNSPARLVAFGDEDTFFVQFEDGSVTFSRDLGDLIGEDALDLLLTESLETVWLGSERHFDYSGYGVQERIGFYIGYNKGECDYGNLPEGVQEWLDGKHPGVKVKQVLADERDNYFIRYS